MAGRLIIRKDPLRRHYLAGKLSRKDLRNRGLTQNEQGAILRAARHHWDADVGEEDLIGRLGEELDRLRQGLPLSFEEDKS